MSKNEQETAITKIGTLIPVFEKPEQVQENIKIFREACKKVLDPKIDIVMINGKEFIRKSGWNVLNQYLGVETKPTKSWRTELKNDEYMITVVVEASLNGTHPQSRSASCTSMEMKAKHSGKKYLGMESHCYGMAETRAVGRASAAWFMIGDSSAEENENTPKRDTSDLGTCMCKPEDRKLANDEKTCRRCHLPFSQIVLQSMIAKK